MSTLGGKTGFIYVYHTQNEPTLINLTCRFHMLFWHLRKTAGLPDKTALTDLELADEDGTFLNTTTRHAEYVNESTLFEPRSKYVLLKAETPAAGVTLPGQKYFVPLLKNVKEVFPNFILETERRVTSSKTSGRLSQASDSSDGGRSSSSWGRVKKKSKVLATVTGSGKQSKAKSRAK